MRTWNKRGALISDTSKMSKICDICIYCQVTYLSIHETSVKYIIFLTYLLLLTTSVTIWHIYSPHTNNISNNNTLKVSDWCLRCMCLLLEHSEDTVHRICSAGACETLPVCMQVITLILLIFYYYLLYYLLLFTLLIVIIFLKCLHNFLIYAFCWCIFFYHIPVKYYSIKSPLITCHNLFFKYTFNDVSEIDN